MDDAVRNGTYVNTFRNGAYIKLLFDSGTSKTLSAHSKDFIKFSPLKQANSIQGIVNSVTPKGEGLVRYVIQAENGDLITIQSRAFYVPNLAPEVRLICPHGIKTLDGKYVKVFLNSSKEEDLEA